MTIIDLAALSQVTGGTAMPKGPRPDLSSTHTSPSSGESSTWKPTPESSGSTSSPWTGGGSTSSPWIGW
jgi:hypothetical protein